MENEFAGKQVKFIEHDKTYTGIVLGLRCSAYLYILPDDDSYVRMIPPSLIILMEEE